MHVTSVRKYFVPLLVPALALSSCQHHQEGAQNPSSQQAQSASPSLDLQGQTVAVPEIYLVNPDHLASVLQTEEGAQEAGFGLAASTESNSGGKRKKKALVGTAIGASILGGSALVLGIGGILAWRLTKGRGGVPGETSDFPITDKPLAQKPPLQPIKLPAEPTPREQAVQLPTGKTESPQDKLPAQADLEQIPAEWGNICARANAIVKEATAYKKGTGRPLTPDLYLRSFELMTEIDKAQLSYLATHYPRLQTLAKSSQESIDKILADFKVKIDDWKAGKLPPQDIESITNYSANNLYPRFEVLVQMLRLEPVIKMPEFVPIPTDAKVYMVTIHSAENAAELLTAETPGEIWITKEDLAKLNGNGTLLSKLKDQASSLQPYNRIIVDSDKSGVTCYAQTKDVLRIHIYSRS